MQIKCCFYNKLLDVLLRSTIDSIPSINKSTKKCSNGNFQKRKVIPGWSDYVERHRKQALFWHQIWIDNNRPRDGVIADNVQVSLCC